MDAELEEFKRLDLRAYAASLGYTLDWQESWRGSAVMRNAADDKIIIKRENIWTPILLRPASKKVRPCGAA
jgi:hypothetical protein